MMEVLSFVFSSFWVWLGTLFLVVAASSGISAFVALVRRG